MKDFISAKQRLSNQLPRWLIEDIKPAVILTVTCIALYFTLSNYH